MRNALICVLLLLISGCASNPSNGPAYDPWENTNRKIFKFNNKFDEYVGKPLAKGYKKVLPDPVEKGIANFFSNLDDVNVFANDILQGKPEKAGNAATRFAINSVFGVLGIFDVSTRVGLPKHYENFGQTLGVWGVGEGPYVVLPLFGPNNLRSTTGLIVEPQTTYLPPYFTSDRVILTSATVLDIVDTRARLLGAGNVLNTALDPYLLLRDTWIIRHRKATLDSDERLELGSANTSKTQTDDIDELDELDELDNIDSDDETDELDELDELDKADELDELDELDKADELDKLDEVDKATQ